MKSHFYIFLLVLLSMMSCSKDNEPDFDLNKKSFLVDKTKLDFVGAGYFDAGSNGKEHLSIFGITSSTFAVNGNFYDDYTHRILISAYSKTTEFIPGSYSVDYTKEKYGDVILLEGKTATLLKEGTFSIIERGIDKYSITIDGVLADGRTISGSYTETFSFLTDIDQLDPEGHIGYEIDGVKIKFLDGLTEDYGYDSDYKEFLKFFYITDKEIITTSGTNNFNYLIEIDAYSRGTSFKPGKYSLDYSKELNGDVFLFDFKSETVYYLDSGEFEITQISKNEYSIRIDGILTDGEDLPKTKKIQGTYKGVFKDGSNFRRGRSTEKKNKGVIDVEKVFSQYF